MTNEVEMNRAHGCFFKRAKRAPFSKSARVVAFEVPQLAEKEKA